MPNYDEMRLAVLIDADNVPYRNIKGILEEIVKHGTPTIKRIYADWTQPTVSGWKTVLLENAIQPIQQYRYSVEKFHRFSYDTISKNKFWRLFH